MSMDFQLALTVCLWSGNERKCEKYFIVSVVLTQKIFAGIGESPLKGVLRIHDVQKCTIAL